MNSYSQYSRVRAFRWDGRPQTLEQNGLQVNCRHSPFIIKHRQLYIKTWNGYVWCPVGDYIVRNSQGEYHSCRADIFRASCGVPRTPWLKLIKADFLRDGNLLYYFSSVLLLYVIAVGMGCRYEQLLPKTYLSSLGTGTTVITLLMIILAATTFSGNKSRQQVSAMLKKGISHYAVFWSRIATLLIQYAILMSIDIITTYGVQRLVIHHRFFWPVVLRLMTYTASANIIYVFLLCSATVFFSLLIKHVYTTVAAGLALEYFGEIPMGFFMILVYHHRWLRWNPFNFLLVQNQIVKPMDHAMSKLSMPDSITGALFYACLFVFFAYMAFSKYFNYSVSPKGRLK